MSSRANALSCVSLDGPRIREELLRSGFALRHAVTLEESRYLMGSLGKIRGIDEIRPTDGSTLYVRSTRAIPFHNEDPEVTWLAWHCILPASCGGATLILDGEELYEMLSPAVRLELQNARCNHRNAVKKPILTSKRDWYLIPWGLPALPEDVLSQLGSAIKNCKKRRFGMQSGDLLILDNRRMFHGRTAFTDVSRSLVRFMAS